MAFLLTLPVLLVAGMSVWLIRAERARVEGDLQRDAGRECGVILERLTSEEARQNLEALVTVIPRWQWDGGEPPPAGPLAYDFARLRDQPAAAAGSSDKAAPAGEATLTTLVLNHQVRRAGTESGLPILPLALHRLYVSHSTLLFPSAMSRFDGSEAFADADRATEMASVICSFPCEITGRLVEPFLPELRPENASTIEQRAARAMELVAWLRLRPAPETILPALYVKDDQIIRMPAPANSRGYLPWGWRTDGEEAGAVRLIHDEDVKLFLAGWNRGWSWTKGLPDTVEASVFWRGLPVAGTGGPGMAADSRGVWKVTAAPTPAFLAAALRERTRSLLWLMAAVLIAVIAAMWLTWRAFKKQAELARMQAEFVASVSHELRTPVAGIGALAERLESGAADAAQTVEYHRMIAREGRRLSALVDNVLDFSRIERGAKAYDFDHADLPRLIRDTAALLRPGAEEKGLTLAEEIAEVPEDRWPAVDAVAIRQALINLLDNAIKFTPAGGKVTVGFSETGPDGQPGQISIFVKDTGIGIPAAEQARIFEKFYRVDNGLRRETTGAGIGLSIVRHIAAAHGARVTVESAAGKGAVFTLSFIKL